MIQGVRGDNKSTRDLQAEDSGSNDMGLYDAVSAGITSSRLRLDLFPQSLWEGTVFDLRISVFIFKTLIDLGNSLFVP